MFSVLIPKPKLRKYATFKVRYEPEEYRIQCKAQQFVVEQIRGGTLPLDIEIGRYVGIPAGEDMQNCVEGQLKMKCISELSALHLVLPRIPLLQAIDSTTSGFKDLCIGRLCGH